MPRIRLVRGDDSEDQLFEVMRRLQNAVQEFRKDFKRRRRREPTDRDINTHIAPLGLEHLVAQFVLKYRDDNEGANPPQREVQAFRARLRAGQRNSSREERDRDAVRVDLLRLSGDAEAALSDSEDSTKTRDGLYARAPALFRRARRLLPSVLPPPAPHASSGANQAMAEALAWKDLLRLKRWSRTTGLGRNPTAGLQMRIGRMLDAEDWVPLSAFKEGRRATIRSAGHAKRVSRRREGKNWLYNRSDVKRLYRDA